MTIPHTIDIPGAEGEEVRVDPRQGSLLRDMATGLTDELIPLLTVVHNVMQLSRTGLERGDQARVAALSSHSAGERSLEAVFAILHRLQEIGRPRAGDPRVVDLADHLGSLRPKLMLVAGEGVDIEIDALEDESPLEVRIDPDRLELALLELVVNAREAMRGYGRITIVARRDPGSIDGGSVVRIEITDSGPGMSSESLEKAFEPFFSTKHRDLGPGLGLPFVRSIIEASYGAVAVDGSCEIGCRVVIRLPILDGLERIAAEESSGG